MIDENEREPEREKSNVLVVVRWAKERETPKNVGTDNITTNVNESANKNREGGEPKEKEQTYACDEGGGKGGKRERE